MIKLFAIDVDGTLLNSDSRLNESTKESIIKLNTSGVKSVLCSGRVATSLDYFNKLMDLDNPVIANNGAIIKLNQDNILKSYPLEDDNLLEIINFCKQHKFFYHFYDDDTFYSNRLIIKNISHLINDNDYGLNIQCNLDISDDPYKRLKDKNKKSNKILIGNLDSHPYGKEKIKVMFDEKFGEYLYMTSSGYDSIEIMEKGVNKWQGLLELSKFLGIDTNEIAAIGDSHNDIPMLKEANLSFAMGNADQNLKDLAKFTVADNNSTGILEAVDKILIYNKENPSV